MLPVEKDLESDLAELLSEDISGLKNTGNHDL